MNVCVVSGLRHLPLSLLAASNTMKISLLHLMLGCCCCAFTLLFGCMPMAGPGPYPIGYPGYPPQPIGNYNPGPYPGGPPGHNVGYPPFPGGPGIPIVMNPSPPPGTAPTIPIGFPAPVPTDPNENSTAFWSPWPLPPRGNQLATRTVGFAGTAAEGDLNASSGQPRRFTRIAENDARRNQLIEDATPTPNEDLQYEAAEPSPTSLTSIST